MRRNRNHGMARGTAVSPLLVFRTNTRVSQMLTPGGKLYEL